MRATLSRRLNFSGLPLRGALLMPLCALVVHQLRFYVVFGSRTPAVLAREGHGYFSVAEPFVLLLATLGLGWFVGRVALASAGRGRGGVAAASARRTWRGVAAPSAGWGEAPRPARTGLVRTWLICALVLFAIYCVQELCEGFFSPGHPSGIAGVLGQGGWTAAPISLLVAAALTMTLRLAHRLLDAVERRTAPLWTNAGNARNPHPRPRAADWRLDPRSGVTAGRAPPRAFSPSPS